MKTHKPNLKSVVAKANELIGQMAKFELSELRLIAYCLAHYDSRKADDNRLFRAKVGDLTNLFPMDQKSAYAVVRKTMLSLGKKPLEIKENSKRYYWNWFSGFIYDEGTGEFEFRITPEIQPYLLKLEGNFTRYRLKDVYQFKAASTWKLYELLKRWLSVGSWEVELEELRYLLCVTGKYPRWSDFEIRLIKSTIKEINYLSDIQVLYEKIKCGRRVVGLLFDIRPNNPEDRDMIVAKSELYFALIKAGLHDRTALRYAKDADRNGKTSSIQTKLSTWLERSQLKANPKSYLQKTIKNEINKSMVLKTPAKAMSQIDFSSYSDEDLNIFERVKGYKEAIKAEKRRRGLI